MTALPTQKITSSLTLRNWITVNQFAACFALLLQQQQLLVSAVKRSYLGEQQLINSQFLPRLLPLLMLFCKWTTLLLYKSVNYYFNWQLWAAWMKLPSRQKTHTHTNCRLSIANVGMSAAINYLRLAENNL